MATIMRTFFILTASAVLLAAVIVELSSRLWPGSALALLVLAALALVVQGYLSLRFVPAAAAGAAAETREQRPERTRSKPSRPAAERG